MGVKSGYPSSENRHVKLNGIAEKNAEVVSCFAINSNETDMNNARSLLASQHLAIGSISRVCFSFFGASYLAYAS